MNVNVYEIEKNVEKIYRGEATRFLLPNICNQVKSRLKKKDYQIFVPYPDAEKAILYSKDVPSIRIFRIECDEELTHSSIMGSLFGLNISSEMFGDIIFFDGFFYLYLLEEICHLVCNNLLFVGNKKVHLVEVPRELLNDYRRNYEKVELVVSSLRIDTVIARLIGMNREKVKDKIQNKLVLVNGEILNQTSYFLRESDIFSIKSYGKYRYNSILGNTKKKNLIIDIDRYV